MAKARANYSRLGGSVIVGHESPHKFDQFSLDHMGTGEGHQAYSNGLYFWENPSVGQSYHSQFKDRVARDNPARKQWEKAQQDHDDWFWNDYKNRLPYNEDFASEFRSALNLNNAAWGRGYREGPHSWSNNFLNADQESVLKSLSDAIPFIDPGEDGSFKRYEPHLLSSAASRPYYTALGEMLTPDQRAAVRLSVDRNLWGVQRRSRREFEQLMDAVKAASPSDWANVMADMRPIQRWNIGPEVPHPGEAPPSPEPFSYHVRLGADREDFPDLNTAIRDQPSRLQEPLMDMLMQDVIGSPRPYDNIVQNIRDGLIDPSKYTPAHMRTLLENRSQFDNWDGEPLPFRRATKFETGLARRNIPGVRYDDYSSRSPDSGSSTQNFVVYDPAIIDIVKRYPYSLLAPALLAEGAKEQQTPVSSPLAGSLLQ